MKKTENDILRYDFSEVLQLNFKESIRGEIIG